jgi:hypothetical protein
LTPVAQWHKRQFSRISDFVYGFNHQKTRRKNQAKAAPTRGEKVAG